MDTYQWEPKIVKCTKWNSQSELYCCATTTVVGYARYQALIVPQNHNAKDDMIKAAAVCTFARFLVLVTKACKPCKGALRKVFFIGFVSSPPTGPKVPLASRRETLADEFTIITTKKIQVKGNFFTGKLDKGAWRDFDNIWNLKFNFIVSLMSS